MTTTMTNEELSVEIARRLFEAVPCDLCGGDIHHEPYASDHNAAMGLVVPEMRKRGWLFKLEGVAPGLTDATFWALKPGGWVIKSAQVSEGEEPRGICEATLAVLDAEEGK